MSEPDVVAQRFFVRNVFHELAHEIRRRPAEHQCIVITQASTGVLKFPNESMNSRWKVWVVEGERMRLRVLEAEFEVDIGLRDDRIECGRDVPGASLVLAMDETELSLRLRARGVEDSLAVGGEQPVFLGLECGVAGNLAHVLARP